MEIQQSLALAVFFGVYVLFASRLVHRVAAGLVGVVVLAVSWGPKVVSSLVPEALLVTGGLMVLAGFVKRSGLAEWLALKAAKAGGGKPARILLLTGLLSFLTAALFGPVAAVLLVVPVSLLLAVELDVPALPFVVVLTWTSLLGGATVLTALPGNLWLASALDIDGISWFLRISPLTGVALAVTLATGLLVFRKSLRATNERRARVLEYDASKSLEDRPLLVKTLTVLVLVFVGLVVGPGLSLAPSVVVVGGATLLFLWDGRRSVDRSLSDIDGATLLFFGTLFVVVGALEASGLPRVWASLLPPNPLALLWATSVLGAFVDQGAVVGALVPMLKAWSGTAGSALWPLVILGSTFGAGATVLGSVSTAAFSLAGQGSRRPSLIDFTKYGILFAVLNLAVTSLLGQLLLH